jgi:hypothetical protein
VRCLRRASRAWPPRPARPPGPAPHLPAAVTLLCQHAHGCPPRMTSAAASSQRSRPALQATGRLPHAATSLRKMLIPFLLAGLVTTPVRAAPIFAAAAAAASRRSCAFRSQPVVEDLGEGLRSWVWSEPYHSDLFADGNLLDDDAFHAYTAWLTKTIPRDFHGLDPLNQTACLVHQRGIFATAGFPTHDWDVILNGSVGAISAANCIESLLWGKQNELHPQRKAATEFGAYILLDGQNTTVKVYLQTGPTLIVPGMQWVDEPIMADLDAGFHLLTFLHLHPFDASNTKYQDCAGTCIPSGPDLNAFAIDLTRFDCETAWITNGQDSFRFPLSQLSAFNGEQEAMATNRTEIYRGQRAHKSSS